jgi:U3 small nucleolar ribonucleoprotein protein IMP4
MYRSVSHQLFNFWTSKSWIRTNTVLDCTWFSRGQPDGMTVCHLPFGPTAYFTICDVVMRHDIPDIGHMSEANPHLIFHNFKTKLGRRAMNILKYLFPVPKEDSRRVITFANHDDYISFRHHTYKKDTENRSNVILSEAGPRFQLRRE